MYCPVCLNDTLKLASSGVVRITFDGKSKATSQFFYNLKEESDAKIQQKFTAVVDDFFSWYSTFQNPEPIKRVKATTSDFKCSKRCSIGPVNLSAFDLVITKRAALDALKSSAQKHGVKLNLKPLA